MPDNVVFQSGTVATPPVATTVAADDVSGVLYQRVKLDFGGDGVSAPVTTASPLPIGTIPGGTVQMHGTAQALGTVQPLAGSVHLASGLPGTVQVLGTIQVHGTAQILGTIQPLAGSVHLASPLPGTAQVLGTVQSLAGSVHVANVGTVVALGSAAHGAAIGGNPVLVGAFGSSGTQAAVADGQAVRLAADLNGRLITRGTIDVFAGTIGGGTFQVHGTAQVLGTTQPLAGSVHLASPLPGTAQVLGTIQPLAGSVHLASSLPGTVQALGTIQAHGTSQVIGTTQPLAGSVHLANVGTTIVLGSVGHGAAVGGAPVLIGAFGSSGTQVAVLDGQVTRLAADLNGRLVVRGTIDVFAGTIGGGTFQAHGTTQALGTVQPLAGSVHLASPLPGTVQSLGTFQPLAGSVHLASGLPGTVQVLGTVQAHGTTQVIGTFQPLAGSVHLASPLPGTAQVLGTVQSHGTNQALGTIQPLAGSVHLASSLPGTAQVLGTVQTHGTSQVLGSITLMNAIVPYGTIIVGTISRPADVLPYAANDEISDSTSGPGTLQFFGVSRVAGYGGYIMEAVCIDSANLGTKAQLELWLFESVTAMGNDNTAFAPTDAQTETSIGVVPFNQWYPGDDTSGAGGNALAVYSGPPIGYSPAGTILYGRVKIKNVTTPVSAEKFTFRLKVRRD